MNAVPTFVEHARAVLMRREQDGIRGIGHERNRFATHIEMAGFAQKRIDDISAVDLRDFVRDMQAKQALKRPEGETLSVETTKRVFALVCAVFTDAVERELIKASPANGVKIRKRADARSTREKWTYLTLEEQKLLAKCPSIPECDRLTIRFAIATGLRQGELYNLHLPDLITGPNAPRVVVRYGRSGLPPKSGKMRQVPLFGDGLVTARRWLYLLADYCPDNPRGLVFPRPDGTVRACGKPFAGDNTFRRYMEAAGITRRVRWHDLRHTFCSNLVTGVLGQTWPLLMVKEMAGHSSVTITERYAHVGQRDLVSLGAASSFVHEEAPEPEPFYNIEWPEMPSVEMEEAS